VKLEGEFLRMKYHTRLQWSQNSCATKWTGWVGWIAQVAYSSEGPTLGYQVIHSLAECVIQCANVPSLKHTPDTMQIMQTMH